MNCAEVKKYEITPAHASLYFEHSATIGETYEFSLVKITEAGYSTAQGLMELGKLEVAGANIIVSAKPQSLCPKQFKFLVFGDSVTVAYGVDGSAPCSFSTATQDVRHGYAFLVAKELKADIHIVGWSGKGVVRNYGDSQQMSSDPLPAFYNRTIAINAAPDVNTNYWDPKQYVPDLSIVMLGSNDYSTQPNPTDEQFTTGLINLISHIQQDYPTSKVLVMCSPSARVPNQCANIESSSVTTKSNFIEIPSSMYDGGYGCDSHPNQISQQNIADYILPYISEILGLDTATATTVEY